MNNQCEGPRLWAFGSHAEDHSQLLSLTRVQHVLTFQQPSVLRKTLYVSVPDPLKYPPQRTPHTNKCSSVPAISDTNPVTGDTDPEVKHWKLTPLLTEPLKQIQEPVFKHHHWSRNKSKHTHSLIQFITECWIISVISKGSYRLQGFSMLPCPRETLWAPSA